jgi:alpha-mannosidase
MSDSRVRVLALKKAEDSDEVIVRIVELDGRPAANVRLSFAAPVVSAREVNGQEQPLGRATVNNGQLVTSLGRYQPRTFALKLAAPAIRMSSPRSEPIALNYDLDVATVDGEKSSAGFNGKGAALPAEMLPREIAFGGITFRLAGGDKPNAVVAKGQSVALPSGLRRVYILAASAGDDQKAVFGIGLKSVGLTIPSWGGFIGQWDDRQWKQTEVQIPPRTPPAGTPPDIAAQLQRPRTRVDPYGQMVGITPGFIKRSALAWFASHHHTAEGTNEAYSYSYLFAYAIDVPVNAEKLTLPMNENIRILAITGSNERTKVMPAQPLYDTLEK